MPAWMRRTVFVALALGAAACGSSNGSSGGSTTSPSGTTATLKLTLSGLTGKETLMDVRYNIGTSTLQRSDAAAVLSQLHDCTGDGASVICTSSVSIGQTVTLYADESSDGVVIPLHGAVPPAAGAGVNEFVSYMGCTAQIAFGDCTVTPTAAQEYDVTANFSVMPEVLFNSVGAGLFTVAVQARNQLSVPVQANGIQQSGTSSPAEAYLGPQVSPLYVAYLPSNSMVTVKAVGSNQAQYKTWQGTCQGGIVAPTPGGGGQCTQVTVDGAIPTVTALLTYWDCTAIGLGIADGPENGCTFVDPTK